MIYLNDVPDQLTFLLQEELSQENSSIEEVCPKCNMVVGPHGTLENHSIQCNGGPSRPSAPTERVLEFSHAERLSEMSPLVQKNFISHALEITETFEEAVDLLMDSKENHLDQLEVTWKRLFLMYKNKMKIKEKKDYP